MIKNSSIYFENTSFEPEMNPKNNIQKKKDSFKLPYHRDQLEYWGPVNHVFSDSFLTMGHTFLYQYFHHFSGKLLKSIFSSFVEMVQNVSEYNEKAFNGNYPQSYVGLKDDNGVIIITTANQIRSEDLLSIKTIFESTFKIEESKLFDKYKTLLMKGDSLGLIMLRRLKNATIDYTFSEENGEHWLSLELKISYGNT